MNRALDEYVVGGVKTNLPLFRQILSDPEFLAGNTDTGLIRRLQATDSVGGNHEVAAIAAGILYALGLDGNRGLDQSAGVSTSNWKTVARGEGLG